MSSDSVRRERTKLSKRLYVNLPTWEITIWTASWIMGVGYAMYQLYYASKRKCNQRNLICFKEIYNLLAS